MKNTKWTHFWDMNSGGGLKEAGYSHIYIEAPEEEAKVIFYNRFGHNPERVSCTCCGGDYSISEEVSLKQATGFERGCRNLKTPRDPETGLYKNNDPIILANLWLDPDDEIPDGYEVSDNERWRSKWESLEDYSKGSDVLIIHADEIKPKERKGEVPEEGYVWM